MSISRLAEIAHSVVAADVAQEPFPQIKIVKPDPAALVSGRRDALLRRIGNAQSEIGRLNKLLDEIRADVLHLTVE